MPLIGSSKHFLRLKRLMRPGQLFQQQKLTILKLFNYWLVAKVGMHWLKRSILPTRIRNMNCFQFQSTMCQMQILFPIATMINLNNWYQFVALIWSFQLSARHSSMWPNVIKLDTMLWYLIRVSSNLSVFIRNKTDCRKLKEILSLL